MINKFTHQNQLIESKQFPHCKFNFEKFNPVQSRVFEVYQQDANLLVSAPTGVGKTATGEMLISHEFSQGDRKAIYLSSLRSLSQEKYSDWLKDTHSFAGKNISICTGDYLLTADRKEEIENAHLIVMSYEMLTSKARNYTDANSWIKNIGTVICDEIHNIGKEGRGPHMENGLMKFTEINPDARIVGLSATMPNTEEIAEWLSKLNGKNTNIIQSDYRPVPLNVHYIRYYSTNDYEENEYYKIEKTINIYQENADDKFICFVHAKKTGEALLRKFKEYDIDCEYHHGSLSKEKRNSIETRFREDDKLRVVVATSTLSQGLNFPARRVIIVGIHRGPVEVEADEIQQECGRAGRPQYDPCGDAYVLLPHTQYKKQMTRLMTPVPIQSKMLDTKTLAFHLVSEIHRKTVKTVDDIRKWFERTLAYLQNKVLEGILLDDVVKRMTQSGIIRIEGDNLEVTSIGIVSSLFYYSPFDVSNLCRNFSNLFKYDKQDDDYWLAMALSDIDSIRPDIVSVAERQDIERFAFKLRQAHPTQFLDGPVKSGCCYYNLLNGKPGVAITNTMNLLKMDWERKLEVLKTLDKMVGKWDKMSYFRKLALRMTYGVGQELTDFCRIKGIGAVKAKKLYDAGFRTLQDLSKDKVMKVLKCKEVVAEQICEDAKLY